MRTHDVSGVLTTKHFRNMQFAFSSMTYHRSSVRSVAHHMNSSANTALNSTRIWIMVLNIFDRIRLDPGAHWDHIGPLVGRYEIDPGILSYLETRPVCKQMSSSFSEYNFLALSNHQVRMRPLSICCSATLGWARDNQGTGWRHLLLPLITLGEICNIENPLAETYED